MRYRFVLWAVLGHLCATGWAQAQEQTTYRGCTDAEGRAVAAVSDPALGLAVASRAGARPEIRYNEALLPRLTAEARLFLFAHECARHNLGLPLEGARTVEDARRADCHALDTLLRSGLIDTVGIDALEREMQFSAAEWEQLPGPPRAIALGACAGTRGGLLTHPAPAQPEWNACVRACGERRRACAPRAAACDDAYERCVSLCDFRSPP